MRNKQLSLSNSESNQILASAKSALETGYELVSRSYISRLGDFPVETKNGDLEKFHIGGDARIFKLERLVSENRQSVLESAIAAYTALGASGYVAFMLLSSDGEETHVYIGTRGGHGRREGRNAGTLLEEAFKGHFSGSQLVLQDGDVSKTLIDGIGGSKRVTAVTGVPSLSTDQREHFVQGLERFIDAAEGNKYQALILAEPVSSANLDMIRLGYEGVATQVSPLLKQQLSYGVQYSDSVALGISKNISDSFADSVALTQTQSYTHTKGTSESVSSSSNLTKAVSLLGAAASIGAIVYTGGAATPVVMAAGVAAGAVGGLVASTKTSGSSESHAHSESTATANTTTTTKTYGKTDSETNTTSQGNSQQISIESINKSVESLLARIDRNLERVEEAKAYGGWDSAAYFMADNQSTTEALASIYLGLMRGGTSSAEDFSLTTWDEKKSDRVLKWLSAFSHPHLEYKGGNAAKVVTYVTPATLVSGKEMALQLSLPRRSTSTVSVIETQAFGRCVQRLETATATEKHKKINVGNIRHLWQNTNQKIEFDIDKLTGHVFVTGSTGAGKSNTIYEIVSQVSAAGVPFLIVEPAKGEYKHVFGHRKDVRVLGTNPAMSELLRINPFAFPKGIHVLEHIDRLVEIFNVCWPMYAAMPAVLKEATLHAYEQCGWDLNTSINVADAGLFPTFSDLLDALNEVIASSEYSDEIKGNYVGALATRVRSLTNGLNGQIFCADEISDEELFDRNVIIDLSRVGSQESKALIMGILIMRLSEYRMTSSGMNQPLRHLTVLEEAHNILRRTSTEQSTEGANVAGKAVEMLTNAIAEMRTYGEGFLIADQSPNAVDIAAIRNTNTKIVMRLPDDADRQLAGKSAAMTDEQLQELARLPRGVAVVYKNNWLEPVLCQVKRFEGGEKEWVYEATECHGCDAPFDREGFNLNLSRLFLNDFLRRKEAVDMDLLRSGINVSGLSSKLRMFAFAHINKRADLLVHDYQLTARNLVAALGLKEKSHRHIRDGLKGKKPSLEPILGGMIAALQKEIKAAVSNECSKDLLFAITDCCFMSNQKEGEQLGVQLYREWQETARKTLV